MNERISAKTLAKYFLHGFAFGIASIGILVAFTAIAFAGIVLGGLIGLGFAFIAAFFFYGLLNGGLMTLLWSPMEWRWSGILGQGVAVFFVSIPIGVIGLIASGTIPLFGLTGIGVNVAALLVDVLLWPLEGYAFVWVGMHWARPGARRAVARRKEPTPPKADAIAPDNPAGLRCPRCGSIALIVAKDHSAFCIDCRHGIRSEHFRQASALS